MKILASFLISCFFLSACNFMPKDFREWYELPGTLTFELPDGLVDMPIPKQKEWALAPGTYVAVKQNAFGTLFSCPTRCIIFKHTRGYRLQSGGVWVSKDPKENLRMFTFAHQDWQDFPDMASAVAAQREWAARSAALMKTETLQTTGVGGPNGSIQLGGGSSTGAPQPPQPLVTQTILASNATPLQAGIAGGVADAVVALIADSEIEKERGVPLPIWPLENEELKKLVSRAVDESLKPR